MDASRLEVDAKPIGMAKGPGETALDYVFISPYRDQRLRIVLAGRDFTSTHLAIIASTGAGTGYLAAVIVQELMKPQNRACVLIVGPHAESITPSPK